ncbi:hypothetical protein F5Y00DRAFT_261283 [Daldinia vernicosa]|uniref:uncharacterized protein n=1 Tax=Daldinia vernicosa TaxID=114800 RepID=UPI00200745CA|nr:uncharacterized protein F5Y00DRAFT_261283 [Daldinia vernicosa]KAI0849836.1 hypothetical protein F5Y00DRAFT_261283 [Daldinia vernicosa]
MSLLQCWHDEWIGSLRNLDGLLITTVRDVTEPESREPLMYDDDKLQRSELYFSVLQLLRIFSADIKDNISQLKKAKDGAQKEFDIIVGDYTNIKDLDSTVPFLQEKWKSLDEKLESIENDLIRRVDRQIEDVKSLRDGLFNAQAVREAVKGRQLNRYLFVFTVITIIFTPLSFVATFYGMHLFDGADADGAESVRNNQKRFWGVFFGVAIVTYILGLLGITSFGWKKWWATLPLIRRIFRRLRHSRMLRFITRLVRQRGRKSPKDEEKAS